MSNIIETTINGNDTTYVFENGDRTITMTLRDGVYCYAHLVCVYSPVGARVVPTCTLKDWDIPIPPKHTEAEQIANAGFFSDYHNSQNNMTEEQEAEHAFELRAAFGPGVKVIDIITGKETLT